MIAELRAISAQLLRLAVVAALLEMYACSWQAPQVNDRRSAAISTSEWPLAGPEEIGNPATTSGARAAHIAYQQLGAPYRYGGATPSGYDCSGLVYYAYSLVGVKLPRTTAGLWQNETPVAKEDMRVGDLLFFRIDGRVSHVGIYLGDDRFVHAPAAGQAVRVERLDTDFYRATFAGAGRPR